MKIEPLVLAILATMQLTHAADTDDHKTLVNADLAALESGLAECFGDKREFASTLVGVQALARDGMLFEIEAIAVRK